MIDEIKKINSTDSSRLIGLEDYSSMTWDLTSRALNHEHSFQVNNYYERAQRRDEQCKLVLMNEWWKINFSDEIQEDEVIFTLWLCWCICTALVIELKDGSQECILTHYDTLSTWKWSDTLRRLLEWTKKDQIAKANLIFSAPGEWEKNDEGKFKMWVKKSYDAHLDLLECSVKSVLWDSIQVTSIGYSESQESWKNDQWVFRIVKGKDNILRYVSEEYSSLWKVFPDEEA